MPELPDVLLYLHALEQRIVGQSLQKVRLVSPFLLRSVEPPLSAFEGHELRGLKRLGKRIVWCFDPDRFLVFHLMIAGRFQWRDAPGAKVPGKIGLAAFDFPNGTLLMTEASSRKRASLHAVAGEAGLAEHERGGLEVLDADLPAFTAALERENRTLKRALTDPRILSGIGNAYSDEILHRAKLSPFKQTHKISEAEVAQLFAATQTVLREWIARLQEQHATTWPKKVTAFRPEMAVHGKYKQPCPTCAAPVQRIRYADKEANYCARCQTDGKLLADRSLSRLLKKDWPKTLDELEARKGSS